MKYHVICEEEKENAKVIRPRISCVIESENIVGAEDQMRAKFPKYKKVRAYKLDIEPRPKNRPNYA